jgi:hypothetical protein
MNGIPRFFLFFSVLSFKVKTKGIKSFKIFEMYTNKEKVLLLVIVAEPRDCPEGAYDPPS